HLLEYFGETPESDCGNCDTCLAPPETRDATEDARKLLSAVYRTGQRFGAQYLIDHLRGSIDPRAERLGHTRLSTFGIGADLAQKDWRTLLRQLVARGYIAPDLEGYGSLRLTSEARPLLRGEQTLHLRKE